MICLCAFLSLSTGAAPYGQYPQAAYGQPIAAYPNPYSGAGYMYPYPQHYGMCTYSFIACYFDLSSWLILVCISLMLAVHRICSTSGWSWSADSDD